MTKLPQIVLFSFLTVLSSQAAETFIKPLVSYVAPSTEGYSDAGAVGFAAGTRIGGNNEHEFSFETHYAQWDAKFRSPGLNADGTQRFVPNLVGYKIRGNGINTLENVTFYIGPNVGATYIQTEGKASGVISGRDSHSAWVLTYGGSAGFIINLSKRLELDIGYRFLRMEAQDDFNLGPFLVRSEAANVSVVSAGLGIKF